PRPPEVAPQPAHLRPPLRLARELRPAPLPRRGRPRQEGAPPEDAGRRLAAFRQPPAPLCLHVGPPGEEAPLHGRRVRPDAGMGSRPEPRLAPPRDGPGPSGPPG